MRFRRTELILGVFFFYAAAVALLRPIAPSTRGLIATLNVVLLLLFSKITRAAMTSRSKGFVHFRDWYPVPLILLAYREMGWLAVPHTSTAFEDYWIVWDRKLLYDWGYKAFIESLGPVFPNLLELAYLLVYGVPFYMVAIFVLYRKRERLDDAYTILLAGTLGAYALYPFFPSEPPRSVFPGADLPVMSALRFLNLAIVGNYGMHTSVFPSGHSAAAFAAAFAVMKLLPEGRWRGRNMMVLAVLIAMATVYGRYHFAIDALAGLGMALLALGLSYGWGKSRAV